MKGARGLLISITGGNDLTLYEVDEAASRIRQEVDEDANIILGATFDSSLEGVVRVSVVATGIDLPSTAAEDAAAAEARVLEAAERLRAQVAAQSRPSIIHTISEPAPQPQNFAPQAFAPQAFAPQAYAPEPQQAPAERPTQSYYAEQPASASQHGVYLEQVAATRPTYARGARARAGSGDGGARGLYPSGRRAAAGAHAADRGLPAAGRRISIVRRAASPPARRRKPPVGGRCSSASPPSARAVRKTRCRDRPRPRRVRRSARRLRRRRRAMPNMPSARSRRRPAAAGSRRPRSAWPPRRAGPLDRGRAAGNPGLPAPSDQQLTRRRPAAKIQKARFGGPFLVGAAVTFCKKP